MQVDIIAVLGSLLPAGIIGYVILSGQAVKFLTELLKTLLKWSGPKAFLLSLGLGILLIGMAAPALAHSTMKVAWYYYPIMLFGVMLIANGAYFYDKNQVKRLFSLLKGQTDKQE